jgi:hypothetical protein
LKATHSLDLLETRTLVAFSAVSVPEASMSNFQPDSATSDVTPKTQRFTETPPRVGLCSLGHATSLGEFIPLKKEITLDVNHSTENIRLYSILPRYELCQRAEVTGASASYCLESVGSCACSWADLRTDSTFESDVCRW